jgi:4-amino-4-deoxy-L-arabinose transferase-like glycosyltransferase
MSRPEPSVVVSAAGPGGGKAAPGGVRRWRTRTIGLVLAVIALAVVLRIPSFSERVFNSDEAYLATQAEVLGHGGRLYLDTVDRKPPVVPYVYAAVFAVTGTHDLAPVRVLAVFAEVATALLLASEARRGFRWRWAATASALLYLLAASAFFPQDALAANFELFMVPLMTAAFVLAARRRTAASGVALAFATLTKQTAAVALLPLAYLAWRQRRARGLVVLAGSFVVPILLAAAVFGFHDFVFWVFTGNGGYLDASGIWGYVAALAARQTGWFLFGQAALVAFAVVSVRRWRDHVDLWLWLASGAVAVVAGLRFFPHYYLQLLPPLVLLAVAGIDTVPARARRGAAIVAAAVAVATCAYFLVPAFRGSDTRDTKIALAAGRYLAAHTSADQRVLVWGQAPEAYWIADRLPATRFATTGFVTGTSGGRPPWRVGTRYAVPGAWEDFLRDLERHPPALIANMSTAHQRKGQYYPPAKYPRFARYLERGGWHVVARVDGVDILAPRGQDGRASTTRAPGTNR